MNHVLRSLRFGAFGLAMAGLVLLAACQESGATPGGDGETIAVTIAPSLGHPGLSAQGIAGDLVIEDVLVVVRDASTGDATTEPDCVVFNSDGTTDEFSTGSTTADCAVSIWDGDSVVARTLQLPPLDGAGSPIPYEFLLAVRSLDSLLGDGSTTVALGSETMARLTTATTLRFENLRSFMFDAVLMVEDPNDIGNCGGYDREPAVEAGEGVSLYLAPLGYGTRSEPCLDPSGPGVQPPDVPHSDFGIGPAEVTLDGVDVGSTALYHVSKRGLAIEVPSSAVPGQTLEVSLPVTAHFVDIYDRSILPLSLSLTRTIRLTLKVTEPPVPTEIDPDLTPPTIEFASTNNTVTELLLGIGPSSDPADVSDVVAFLGVQQIALEVKTIFSDSNANGSYVNYQAFICSDFSRFFPTGGETGTNLELDVYAIDPTGNQSVPYTVPITVNFLYSGPSGSCTNTSTL